MNRSTKGFGLVGVAATVVLLIIAAIFSASSRANTLLINDFCYLDNMPVHIETNKPHYPKYLDN